MIALCKRWYKETNNFHLHVGEMTFTLDNMVCLLRIPIKGKIIRHADQITYEYSVQLVTNLLGVSEDEEIAQTDAQWG